jgi:hypothetical protein
MQIKKNRAIYFKDYDGIQRCGVIRDFEKFDDGMILIVQAKTSWFTILDSDIVLKPVRQWID